MSTLVVLVLVVLLCSAMFSCSETAFFSLSRLQLRQLRDDRRRAAQRVVHLLRQPRDLLIGILLGNELANHALAVVTAGLVSRAHWPSWVSTVVTVGLVTPVVLVVCELLPKNLAVNFAPQLSRVCAVPISGFQWLTTPVRVVLTRIGDIGVRCFGGDPQQVRAMIVEEEFQQLVDLGRNAGELSEAERQLIHGVFSMADRTVADVMTPAASVFRVPITRSTEQIVEELRAAQFSRVPVYRDDPYRIIGLLYIRDVAPLLRRAVVTSEVEVADLVRPILRVAGATRVDAMLKEFQHTKVHLAVVEDADGMALGIVTMDDLLDMMLRGEHTV